jgi:glycosyltransferase involved in cell wall biosynthesis
MVIDKCYRYALQENITIGKTGISEHPAFSNWPEVNIWKQKTKAKLEDRKLSLRDNIKAKWDFRKNPLPKITIVVVTYNRHEDLLENLYALNEQSEKDFEVIVLDNSGDLAWLKEHKDEFQFGLCGIELEFNFGPSPAKNMGTDFAKADYVIFLDDDAVADKNLVRNILEHLENHNISGLRGKVLPKNQTSPEDIPVGYDLGNQIITSACEVSCLSAFRKDVLIEMGGFDELLFGSEGMELSYRICKCQKEKMRSILYFPDVIVYHNFAPKGPAHTEKILRQERMELLAWRKDNHLTGYKEHIQSLYPGNKAIYENLCNNYPWIINIALYLSNTFPEQAIEWAKKAVALKPESFKGRYILGSLYAGLGKYNKALPILERIYRPLCNSVLSDRNEFDSNEFDEQVDISECYIKTCTQLAQCYIQNKQFEKVKRIYTELLDNQNLTLAKEQKEDVLNVLSSLERISSTSAIAKNKAVVPDKSEDDYLVSAIISTYNSEKFLSGCLEDLEHQTIADKMEIIVVNSGSQENEETIVYEYQQKYNNIVYIKTDQREGIYSAWNRAAKVARGSFLTNANTDDRHRDDALEIMAETLLANPDIALVYGDQICTDTPNCTFTNHHAINMAKRPEYSFERLLFGCCVGSQPMWRKTLHNEIGYFDETLTCAGDWDFWLRISRRYKFKHIPEFLGLYYYNKDGIEHGRKIHSLYERYIVGKRYGNPYISVIPLYHSKGNPLVSVIMPAYNAAEYIAEAIESVLIQNYRNFELIIVDDGSTDNTKEIVASFKDDKIKYFYKNNGGPSGARNLAIKKAKGQYIMPLDADDMMTPDFITRHLSEFEKHPDVDLVYSDVLLIDKNSTPIRIMNKPEYQDRRYLIRDLFRAGHPIVPFRLGIKRSVFEKIGFYDESLLVGEDYDMMRRFVKAGLNPHHLSESLHLRRMRTDSLSGNFSAQKADCHFEVIRRFADTFTYDELFPDVDWDKIDPRIRQLHAKCLTAGTYLALGQEYIKSNTPEYSKTAFDRACSELNDCVQMDPENRDLQRLFKKSQLIRARYLGESRQVVSR